MKQLIPQSRIDEAAKDHSNKYWGENYITECKNYNEAGFNAGVQFTLNEIQPLIVEFAEWFFVETDKFTRPNLYSVVEWSSLDNAKLYTAEQLLEEFINYKNK